MDSIKMIGDVCVPDMVQEERVGFILCGIYPRAVKGSGMKLEA